MDVSTKALSPVVSKSNRVCDGELRHRDLLACRLVEVGDDRVAQVAARRLRVR
jgi:hypothetical protein